MNILKSALNFYVKFLGLMAFVTLCFITVYFVAIGINKAFSEQQPVKSEALEKTIQCKIKAWKSCGAEEMKMCFNLSENTGLERQNECFDELLMCYNDTIPDCDDWLSHKKTI